MQSYGCSRWEADRSEPAGTVGSLGDFNVETVPEDGLVGNLRCSEQMAL